MTAYYNEWDAYPAQWLRNLMDAGHITPGVVDETSITEVTDDLSQYRRVHLFAGIGGWELALRIAGWPQGEECWTGSCPCQPFSGIGKRRCASDSRHLWPDMRKLVDKYRPSVVLGEQVAGAAGRKWLAGVRDDLEAMGYVFGAADLCASCVGSPMLGQRLFWVASAKSREDTRRQSRVVPNAWASSQTWIGADGGRFRVVPESEAVANGLSERLGRVRAYGNAIVPQVAAEFIAAFMECVGIEPEVSP